MDDTRKSTKKAGRPCERLLGSPDVSEECKAELRRRRAMYNPAELDRKLNETEKKLLKLNGEKVYTGDAPCQGGGQVPAS
jgi:hypothetical protein